MGQFRSQRRGKTLGKRLPNGSSSLWKRVGAWGRVAPQANLGLFEKPEQRKKCQNMWFAVYLCPRILSEIPRIFLARASTFDPSLYELNYFAREPVKHLMEITVQLINEVLPRLPGNRFLVFFFCKEGGQKRVKMIWMTQFATFDYGINWIRFSINCLAC